MNNTKANLLFVLAMALFAVQDLFVKRLTVHVPASEVIFFLGLGAAIIFAAIALRTGKTLFPPISVYPLLYLRTVSEAFCAIFIITSLSTVPLATFATVFQEVPLVVTMGARVFVMEEIGWRGDGLGVSEPDEGGERQSRGRREPGPMRPC